MALNIVATKELAWQERKAIPFTASPLHVGSGNLAQSTAAIPRGLEGISSSAPAGRGSYRSASDYCGGMKLGTAMTISGAAASPNMGYNSSAALSLLLTFFNVRLGAWLGNPGTAGEKTFRKKGPTIAALPLIQEALGLTTDDRKYVYLSDGGHFENLGIYEMLRRRCQYIFVCDATCDPLFTFEDLGNAVRKASIDLGISISFRAGKLPRRATPLEAGSYCGAADIVYPESTSKKGLLLYLKPTLRGDEPASVRSYAAAHDEFPHESTTEQWFGESQFEAYRALGEHQVKALGNVTEDKVPQSIEKFFHLVSSSLA